MTPEELKELLECDEIRDTWEYVQEFVEKFGKIPEDQDELVVCVNYVLECMQSNHQISVTDEWQVAEGLYKCTKRMFDGTPEGKILFEVGEVYKCLSKHDIAEFEVSYGHSVFIIDPVVKKHFIPLGKKDMDKAKIKKINEVKSKILSNKAEAIAFMQRTGIYDENGKLKKPYK